MFLDNLKKESAKTTTQNGAVGYKTTLNNVLDFNLLIGNSIFLPSNKLKNKFDKSYSENPLLTAKSIFYGRDIEQGGGDKKYGRIGIRKLLDKLDKDKYYTLFNLVVNYGSYRDLTLLLGQKGLSNEQIDSLTDYLLTTMSTAIDKVKDNQKPNNELLVFKYLPSETTKSSFMKVAYKRLLNKLNITNKQYRKLVTKYRKELKLVETDLTTKNYPLDYNKIPSQAMLKYKNAFYRNDKETITKHFEKLNNKDTKENVKVNTKTLEPYQLVSKISPFGYLFDTEFDKDTVNYYNTLWDNLPNQENDITVLPVIDTSGSMSSAYQSASPIDVATSLGIYLSEQNKSYYHNHFFTFSSRPELLSFNDNQKLYDKLKVLSEVDWGMDTNLESVFDTILTTALSNNHKSSDLPKVLLIISDMHFNACATDSSDSFFETMRKNYQDNGYELPFIVFWNVNGTGETNHPTVATDKNVCQVSGFSKNIFKSIMDLDLDDLENYTPEKVLVETLSKPRYDLVERLFN